MELFSSVSANSASSILPFVGLFWHSMRILLLPILMATACSAALPPEQVEFFEAKIRPVLASECVECHGADKQKGGLRLDFRDGWKAGGDSGPAIVPGKPGEGLLLRSIRHNDAELKMPKKRPKLSDATIADFEKWIALGAPDPRDQPAANAQVVPWEKLLAERKTWWSFQPVQAGESPAVRDAAWSADPIDRFLLARMEAAGLTPAPDAEARTVYRRLCYVLTGLPPSPEDAAVFEKAAATNRSVSLAEATDRLLASPRFGEHWARHWMDLVRYAETHGSEGDPAIPEAWRYRDYLIRAFNDDLPLDALIREHLAGDQVPPRWNKTEGWNEALLGLAHFRLVEHGFQPVDTRDEQVKVVDSQIDVLCKAFQGLTVSCARCHDHKFDAISQRDYTALCGILESSRPVMRTIDNPAEFDAARADLARRKEKVRTQLARIWDEETARLSDRLLEQEHRAEAIAQARQFVEQAERQLTAIQDAVRARVVAARPDATGTRLPAPIARWSFEKDARDSIGQLNGELSGGAAIRDGRLVLDGKEAMVRTAPLGRPLREKTLEAWVALSSLEQGGGGVITIENEKGAVFDAIVFAEKEAYRWMAGSEFYRRSRPANGPEETAKPHEFVHLVAVYRPDNTIALFRNGQLYGKAWTPGEALVSFDAQAHLLFGRRHAGGTRAALAGEIEEARLYDRALSAEEIAASWQAGPSVKAVSPAEVAAAFTEQERTKSDALRQELVRARQHLEELAPGGKDVLSEALADAAKNPSNPLHAWATHRVPLPQPARKGLDRQAFPLRYREGPGPSDTACGDFTLLPEGDRVVSGLLPAGVSTGALTRKYGGVASTRRFQITTDFISIYAAGANAQCRLIIDGYPLGVNPIFPRAILEKEEPRWLKLDVKYRKGAWAYLEFATAGDLTRPEKDDPRSWFAVSAIVAHDGPGPEEAPADFAPLFANAAGPLWTQYRNVTHDAILAWQSGTLTEPQRQWLDYFLRHGLLTNSLARLGKISPELAQELTAFRIAEAAVRVPRRSPGVMDADSYDAALLPRGNHLQPGAPVPRGYLGALGDDAFAHLDARSGRLELARALTSPDNPLTARVMVNRIWLHLFGQGLVSTPDSFGKMGEQPTHPELLDFLAARFVADGWSAKKMIRALVLTRAWQLSSDPTLTAQTKDAPNVWLSHARVRRLEAESIRDSLLVLSGQMDATMSGPGVAPKVPRRSIYLTVRRTALNPFLTTFDAPRPFSTLGRRDSTNVPAQSLALLNDPFVADAATRWAARHTALEGPARVRAMFEDAFGRMPSESESAAALRYLTNAPNAEAWADLADSLLNVKEFIYLR